MANFSLSGGSAVSHAVSPLATNGQSQCSAMQDGAGRSSAGPGSGTGAGEGFTSKMSASSDCSVASQNACGGGNAKNNEHKGQGGQYSHEFSSGVRQMILNGEQTRLSHGGGGGKGGGGRGDLGIPDDTKLLANPKGIIKSFLPQAAVADSQKFDAYRELCFAHADEYYKSVRGGTSWAVCHICSSSHAHWNTLQRHLQTHIDFRPFSCEQCGRTFYSQSKLKRHQVIHTDVRPYKCPVCDRRLGRTEHLKRHLLVHTDDKPYGCSACAHITKRLDGIRRHIKRKHGVGAGAEIVLIAGAGGARVEGQALADIRQVMSVIDESEQRQKPKAKKKKKKKKKLNLGASPHVGGGGAADGVQQDAATMEALSKDYGSNLLEMANRFGLADLRLPSADRASSGLEGGNNGGGGSGNQGGKEGAKASFHGGGDGPTSNGGGGGHSRSREGEELKPAWPDGGLLLGAIPSQQQMHLLYHSLARSGHTSGALSHGDASMGGSAPCNLTNDGGALRGGGGGQSAFCPDRAVMMSAPGGDHPFIMNSSSGPMRYLATPGVVDGNGGGRAPPHVNPMLFSPRHHHGGGAGTRSLAHFGGGDVNMSSEAMISQYIQSQQRFAPPVWGFANPNYHNY